jgi:hypothetical protein
MNNASIAPCGVICDLCLSFQRNKSKCVGCNNSGNKPYHCNVCSIKSCPEKNGNEKLLCNRCNKFPCRRIKDLDKRYKIKYGISPIQNLLTISQIGLNEFVKKEKPKWICPGQDHLLCVHKDICLICGAKNKYFPDVE